MGGNLSHDLPLTDRRMLTKSEVQMPEIDRFGAILWDNDGILVNTESLYFAATHRTMAEVGVSLDKKTYQQYFLARSGGAWHLLKEAGISDRVIEELKLKRDQCYVKLLTRSDLLIEGVYEVLGLLNGHLPMAIVTGAKRAHFAIMHANHGIEDFFEFILTREDYTASKPSPEPYLMAASRIGVSTERCLVIEDSARGLMSAWRAGMPCWVVRTALAKGVCFDKAERILDQVVQIPRYLLNPS